MDGYHASQAANPNTIPVADAAGKLSGDWLPPMEAATVGGYSPSATPGASRIPVADAAGKLASGWIPDLGISGVPTGGIVYIAGNTVPTGFVKANGGELSRTTYAALFAVIGTTYGAGNGSTTFNVPDLRGEFIRGFDNGRSVDSGRVFGSWQADAFRSHRHVLNIFRNNTGGGSYAEDASNTNPQAPNYTEYEGGTETRPRNIALLAIIKY